MQSHLASILMLLVTMVIWGSTFVVTKGINDQVQPFTLAFVRVAIGAFVLLGCALVRQWRGGAHSRWSALPWGTMVTMGLVGVVVYYAVFNYSLVYTSASQGALVQSCIPAMTALVAVGMSAGFAAPLSGCMSTRLRCAGQASRCRWSAC